MSDTAIQWTNKTWNPVTGCTRASAGCDNCYAQTLHNSRHAHLVKRALPHRRVGEKIGATIARLRAEQEASIAAGKMTPLVLNLAPCYDTPFADVQVHEDRLREPLSWRTPQKVFTCSMADLLHDRVPRAFLVKAFGVMVACYWHTFQVLTKRARRLRDLLSDPEFRKEVAAEAASHINRLRGEHAPGVSRSYAATLNLAAWNEGAARNIWCGVSVENQEQAEQRLYDLLEAPAIVHFVSNEPGLGRVDFRQWMFIGDGFVTERDGDIIHREDGGVALDWIIVGGESGPGARPFDIGWARDVIRQVEDTDVAVFVKQLGSKPFERRHQIIEPGPGAPRGLVATTEPVDSPLKLRDRHGGDISEWPADLQVRQWPGGVR